MVALYQYSTHILYQVLLPRCTVSYEYSRATNIVLFFGRDRSLSQYSTRYEGSYYGSASASAIA